MHFSLRDEITESGRSNVALYTIGLGWHQTVIWKLPPKQHDEISSSLFCVDYS